MNIQEWYWNEVEKINDLQQEILQTILAYKLRKDDWPPKGIVASKIRSKKVVDRAIATLPAGIISDWHGAESDCYMITTLGMLLTPSEGTRRLNLLSKFLIHLKYSYATLVEAQNTDKPRIAVRKVLDAISINKKEEAILIQLLEGWQSWGSICGNLNTPDFQLSPRAAELLDVVSNEMPLFILSQLRRQYEKRSEGIPVIRHSESTTDLELQKSVFIGHGASLQWTTLRDYLQNDLGVDCIEYNSRPVAGMSIKERLKEMLDQACFALLVMTGDDEHADGRPHARQNVVHEIGLFQGRLGFEKAIVLLEESCEEFSNIHGLNQIRFSKGRVEEAFDEIHDTLYREGVLK